MQNSAGYYPFPQRRGHNSGERIYYPFMRPKAPKATKSNQKQPKATKSNQRNPDWTECKPTNVYADKISEHTTLINRKFGENKIFKMKYQLDIKKGFIQNGHTSKLSKKNGKCNYTNLIC